MLAFVLAVSSPAVAASAPSNWWFDAFGVAQVQAAGIDGSGVKIAVIDGQINPDIPVFDGTHLHVDDQPLCAGGTVRSTKATDAVVHGSDVTALLIGNGTGQGKVRGMVPGADLTFYGWGMDATDCDFTDQVDGLSPFGLGLKRAAAGGAQIISMSFVLSDFYITDADVDLIARLLAEGVVLVAGTANKLDDATFPFSGNGVVAVNAFDENGDLQRTQDAAKKPNVWPEVTVVAPGVNFPSVDWAHGGWITGSSLATPLVAGIIAAAAQKYPEATGNQLIQSLIRNTGTKDHDLARDTTSGFGYGPASLRHILAVDPTGYPDENPLMDKSSGTPTVEQVQAAAGGSTPSPPPSPSVTAKSTTPPAAASPAPDTSGGSGIIVAVVLGVVVLLAIAIVIVIVVVSRRRKTRSTP
ncbi:S8 family peptidase [Microbacterium protaetiae]|uniref:S8 family peptidase n=1 Tax=Microbacterium protaetiae TaxID=2509458 RepID=UPI0013EB948A|nr:S8/S53 family peptidase [Microbacterium protaetiae]